MGQLIVSAAGAVIGGWIGGPTGAQWGWAIGSAIGGAVFAPKTSSQGPRISDLRVTGTEYGQTIPFCRGRPTISGQMWWASQRREIAISETQEAKGGPSHTTTSFEYEVDLLIGFTYNEMAGVAEIIADGQLVWSNLPEATDGEIGNALSSARWRRFTFYPGDFEQLPDPTYEAAIGVGRAPAYRGRCYIFFEGYQLGQTGRIPNIQATLFSKGTPGGGGYADRFNDALAVHYTAITGDLGNFSRSESGDAAPYVVCPSRFSATADDIRRTVPSSQAIGIRFKFIVGPVLTSEDAGEIYFKDSTGTVNRFFFIPRREAAFDPAQRPLLILAGTSFLLGSSALEAGEYQFHLAVAPGVAGGSTVSIASLPGDIPVVNQVLSGTFGVMNIGTQGFVMDSGGTTTEAAYADLYVLPLRAAIENETLKATVDHLLARLKAPSGSFDTTALASITTPVRGIVATQITPTRQILEYLAGCYFFEAYGGTFVPRGGAAVATIEFEKLGATESADPEESPFDITIGSELESAASACISYMNIDTQCARDAQYSDRELTDQLTTTITEVPLAFTASEAKAIVDAWMLDQRAARKTSKIALLAQESSAYTPTDVLNITAEDDRVFRLRVVRKRESGPVISFDVVADDASALEQLGITSADYQAPTTIPGTPQTVLALMDSGIWRDADDDVGLYSAARGLESPWPGARLFKSTDDATYTTSVDFIASAVIGTATNALGDFTGGFVWDEASTVDVVIPEGATALASSTRTAMQADASINCAFLRSGAGWEALRYRDATLVATRTYRLHGFLRGLNGTEEFIDGHASNDRFVKVDTSSTRRVPMETTEVGATRYFRAVTAGALLSSAVTNTHVHGAVGRKPWRPSNMRAERDTSGNATITFDRRSRLSVRYGGTGGSYVPPADIGETYELDIYDGSVIVRTLTSATPSFAYSAANQTTDFGSTQFPIEVEGFARSTLVGRGYGLRANV